MTALSDEINKVRGFSVGGVDYLTKPLHYQEALIRIEAPEHTETSSNN